MAEKINKVPVRLTYGYWATEDKKTPAGTIIDLPLDEAKKLIALGKAERADPFPGEK